MRLNTAKRRMLAGKPALGVEVGLGSPLVAEILSIAGFDFVQVDHQHGAWDYDTAMMAFRGICYGTATPVARVEQNDYYAIGHLLDRGTMGIVVPMVNSASDAEAAAFAARYPPRGGRSIGPFGAGLHGARSEYRAQIDDELFLAVQIETQAAVDNAEEILGVEGIDGCWVGPTDLAASLGVDPGTKEHEAAILHVLDACRKTKKIPGIAAAGASAGGAQKWLDRGFLYVVVGGDRHLLAAAALETLQKLGREPRKEARY